jgi:Histidine phosphatase superfamily (branch 1)
MRLHALYSSPLRHARETADPIARAAGLPVRIDSRLRERLNWDGTQTFDAFLADWDRSTQDRDLVLVTASLHGRLEKGCEHFSLRCLVKVARSPL